MGPASRLISPSDRQTADFLESWQIECCADVPSAVGDRVEWGLLFIEPQPADPHGDRPVTLELTATRIPAQ